MRKFLTALVAVAALTALTAAAVSAVPPTSTTRTGGLHFIGQPDASIASNFALVVTGEVAGAGPTATATVTADVEIVRGCINRGAKGQEPSGLQRTFGDVTASQTFNTRSGRGSFNLNTGAVTAEGFTCPDAMTPVVVSVTYSNILLTVTSQTGTVTATFPDLTRTR